MTHEERESLLQPKNNYGTNGAAPKGEKKPKSEQASQKVPLLSLFRYATTLDKFLLFLGSLFAIINGAGWPLLAIVFGQMTNTFIQQAGNPINLPHKVNSSMGSTILHVHSNLSEAATTVESLFSSIPSMTLVPNNINEKSGNQIGGSSLPSDLNSADGAYSLNTNQPSGLSEESSSPSQLPMRLESTGTLPMNSLKQNGPWEEMITTVNLPQNSGVQTSPYIITPNGRKTNVDKLSTLAINVSRDNRKSMKISTVVNQIDYSTTQNGEITSQMSASDGRPDKELSKGLTVADNLPPISNTSGALPSNKKETNNITLDKVSTPVGSTSEELSGLFVTVSTTVFRKILSITPLLQDEGPSSPYDSISGDAFEDYMSNYALYYVYIGIAVFVSSFIQVVCWEVACVRQIYRLRQEFFYQLLRQEIGWFDMHQSGEIAVKLNDNIERIREGIGDKCALFIQYSSTFLAGFVVGFFAGWELTLVIMAMTPLLALSSAFIGKIISSSASREQQKYAVAGGIAEEVLSSIRTVAAFNGQLHEVKRYTEALDSGKQIALKKYLYMSLGIGFTFLVLYGTYALAFWYGSLLILDGKMDPGTVFTVFFAVMIGSFSLGNAVPQISSIATAKGSAALIFEVIDSVPSIDPYSEHGARPASFKADVEFRNVHFNYPARKTVEVLKGLSLKIKEGQTVALCGASGSGKSTIVNLILRFYDTTSGRITVGGFDLKSLNLAWLRSITGVVSQEPVLFNCTIAQNIEYGQKGVTFPEIVKAAKMANAHDFIVSLPQGYDTMVGEGGSQLSGGQKQRIAIARALVRDPKILLLDEATSALDAESEGIVQEALDKARQGRTTIIVAHRLSTIKDADVIYVMEQGRVVEEGNHQELMDKEGTYHQLVTNQVFLDEAGYSTAEASDSATSRGHKRRRRSSVEYQRKTSLHASERDLQRLFSDTQEEEAEIPSGWKILKTCTKEWKYIVFGSIAAAVVGVSLPVFAIFYSEMFQTFTLVGDDLKKAAFFWSMMFLVLAVASFLGNCYRTLELATAGENLTMRLRQEAFTNILRLHIGWFDDENHSTGKITTRLATDVPMVKSAAGHRIGTVITSVVTLGTSLIVAFIFGWKLALGLLIAVPILLAAGAVQMKIEKGNQKRDAELMADAGMVATEAAENIRTVQALTQEETFFRDYVFNLLEPFMENKKNALVYAIAFAFSQGIIFFIYAAAFRLGAYLVVNGDMEIVNVYRVFFAMAFSAVSVGQWSSYLPDYTKARLSAGLVFKLINTQPEIDSYSKGGIQPEIRGEITFSDVHFRYPSRKTFRVLRGFNLHVKPGQTVALVGPSGCGKSTTISLILRFYDPNRGFVKVDGFDIRTINLPYLRKHIAIVSQEPVLFNCSIRDNIAYGLEEPATEEEVKNAARLANAHDFICRMPQGYDTHVGEKGTQLSGGQKQRIAIARALVRDPRILLLDEATSALDTESEKVVQAALDKARQGRTCIVVAHRLSTIQHADCIMVVDQGKVVEQGKHEELIAEKGLYYKLTKKQRIKQ